ncbi:hypothetical protein KAFR_0A03710 [Kazachstania africana CBS 2517]|uniref:mitogen-activated protein kinase kinase n=1 Tax=Kazachstania africana (strain ATCC 22294 / BCRC 22015 / CBS 2517 / CECT 1963 / NBRC 1671 / NRRL Y-8276) TaxID=1071382 RepID=H2AN56_KAZAF|nr:hypothetical protein KAFR_0A03710 [Kazachstania africana CBS 2517]CCF55806.1 hypothetical protein KAFR_0A03710 [Kazachstania africana CBS 2517]
MASIFRPPESARPNSKSPRLKLPQSTKNTTETDTRVNDIENSTPPLSISTNNTSINLYVPPSSGSISATSSSAKSPSSAISSKRRPLPPPLPQLNVNSNATAKKNRPPPVLTPVDITSSLKMLELENKDEMHAAETANNTPFMKKEFNESVDSYLSTFISAYDGTSSSTNTSPVKPAKETSLDVDQLDDESWKFNYMNDQIVTLGILGEGAGGSVSKCKLKEGSKIFALKTINTLNTDPEFQKQLFRELLFNKSFKSAYIVRYYGMFTDEGNSLIYLAMEYMGGRSLDAVYRNLLKRGGRISEKVLGKISESVLRGLSYLHEKKVIHRDIKPQNILINELGEVKLCDFGVSGEAVNSLATTFTGTSFYMAPERIQGQPYSVTCDVWSLGLTILEVAKGKFPFDSDKVQDNANIAPIELLVLILTFTPELKDEPENDIFWSDSFKSFIEYCLKKDPGDRPSPRQMLNHPWIQGQMKKKVNMEKFIRKCWELENY